MIYDITEEGITSYDTSLMERIISGRKGDFKFSPTIGVGIQDHIDTDEIGDLLRDIRKELLKDKAQIEELNYVNGNLHIKGYYEGN